MLEIVGVVALLEIQSLMRAAGLLALARAYGDGLGNVQHALKFQG